MPLRKRRRILSDLFVFFIFSHSRFLFLSEIIAANPLFYAKQLGRLCIIDMKKDGGVFRTEGKRIRREMKEVFTNPAKCGKLSLVFFDRARL